MDPKTVRVPSSATKLRALRAASAIRGGRLGSNKEVASALKFTPGRLSQVFSGSNPSAESGVSLETVEALAKVFYEDGIGTSLEMLCLPLDDFLTELAQANPDDTGNGRTQSDYISDWAVAQPITHTDLAIAQLHPPRKLNIRPECYYLDVSVRFDVAEFEDPDLSKERAIEVGIKVAKLLMESTGYIVAQNTLLGDVDRPAPGVVARAKGVLLCAAEPELALLGNPIGDQHLAVIEPVSDEDEQQVSISLEVSPRGFSFATIEDGIKTPCTNPNKNAILSLVFGELLDRCRTDTGSFQLAAAKMRKG